MLQDATTRWRSSKTTKQTRTRRCKTFKCCKMLLEDEGDETRPRGSSTRHHRARLLKITRDDRARLVSSRMLRSFQTHFLLFQQIFFVLVCIHPRTPRMPPRVLASGPKPCGGNKVNRAIRWVQETKTSRCMHAPAGVTEIEKNV